MLGLRNRSGYPPRMTGLGSNDSLSQRTFEAGLSALGDRDPCLRAVLAAIESPPFWVRDPGFPTLVHIILEQQVSLASAKAAFERLQQVVPELTPVEFLKLDAPTLKRAGFSGQKAGYCANLARALTDGSLELEELNDADARCVRSELLGIKGIGRWTADIYLLMALRRPDIWPTGDLALAASAQVLKRLDSRPTPDQLSAIGESWKPWRSIAARILWHHYLSGLPILEP